MALGEWLSVQSSRELYEHQIADRARGAGGAPEEEREELALIYQAKGLPPERGQRAGRALVADPRAALDTLAREELGIDPEELGGSAWVAAITSFLLFALGAIVPVVPYFCRRRDHRRRRQRRPERARAVRDRRGDHPLHRAAARCCPAARQVVFGLAAAAITFGVGRLIGGV